MIISRAPLRVSFFGGGTDYPEFFREHGGVVLATAIDKYSYVTASTFHSRLFEYSIRVSYRQVELVKHVEEIQHRVFRACLDLCGLRHDIELHNVADLPAFTGLGSSSTFTVSLLHALHAFKGEAPGPAELALEAIHVERDILGEEVGCQDQVMAAFGGFNLVEFRSERDISVTPVNISQQRMIDLERHMLLIFTNIRRKASEVVAQQLKRLSTNIAPLKAMQGMAYGARDILSSSRPLREFGELLHEAWMAKRGLDHGVSNHAIDEMYEQGRRAGAWGGKLLGAGGGGFMLFLAPPELHPQIMNHFQGFHAVRVRTNAPGSNIIFSHA
jgi:D-glycero-alpha-D-manno-heptose-7-phosphate kinase